MCVVVCVIGPNTSAELEASSENPNVRCHHRQDRGVEEN